MQTIELSDFQGNLDSLLGRERCEKRGTGSPFGVAAARETWELVPLLDCCPWSRGNWFPFWIAAARGIGGTGSPFGVAAARGAGGTGSPFLSLQCAYKKGCRTSDVIPLDDNLVSPHVIFYLEALQLHAFAHAESLYLVGHTVAL